jgi:hypothetical protein
MLGNVGLGKDRLGNVWLGKDSYVLLGFVRLG